MEHIRQKNTINSCYTVVITKDWYEPLENHPCLLEHPELFEISSENIPDNCQFLNYN